MDILLIVSNQKHNIGVHDKWSKAGLVYAFVVALAYPIPHSALFVWKFGAFANSDLPYVDPYGWVVKSKFFCNNFRKFNIQHISAT